MTYHQQPSPTHHDDDADEASSLLLPVTDASPSFLLGQDGVAIKKNHGVRMIVVVAICFLLGTMAVIHQGSNSSSNIRAPDDTTMLNQDMMLVGVQEEEQVEGGHRCCPDDEKERNKDGWCICGINTSVCKSQYGGHCCPDSISKHYTWWIGLGHKKGCYPR